MTDEPITVKSMIPFNILQFVIILLWSLIAFSTGWEHLASAHSDPIGWIATSVTVLGILSLPLLVISWYMKQQVVIHEVHWNLKEQEISIEEYERIYEDYLKNYSHLISWFDFSDFILFTVILTSTNLIPLLMAQSIFTIGSAPYVYGFLVILYGLLLSRFSFKLFHSTSSIHSELVPPRKMRKFISLSLDIDGIAYAGVGMQIKEASGYYTLTKIRPTIRLEGIEGVAKIQFVLDGSFRLTSLISELSMTHEKIDVNILSTDPLELDQAIRNLMISTYQKYIEIKGSDPLLIDLLNELGIDIRDE